MVASHQPDKNIHIVDWGRLEGWANVEDLMDAKIGARGLTINLTGIDYGYSQDGTVQEFLMMHRGASIPIKGGSNPDAKTYHTTTIEADATGKAIKGGMLLYVTNTYHYKSICYAKLGRCYEGAETNIITIPKIDYLTDGTIDRDFTNLAKQLTSENYYTEAEKSPNKKAGWQKVSNHADNHLWDCLYMQVFLRDLLKIDFKKKKEIPETKNEDKPVGILDRY